MKFNRTIIILILLICFCIPAEAKEDRDLKNILTPQEEKELRLIIDKYLSERKKKLINEGKIRVNNIEASLLTSIINLKELDPFNISEDKKSTLIQKVNNEVLDHQDVIDYSVFPEIKEASYKHSQNMLEARIEKEKEIIWKKVMAHGPPIVKKFSLEDLKNRDDLKMKIAKTMWKASHRDKKPVPLENIQYDLRKKLLDRAEKLIRPRENMLIRRAKESLNRLSKNSSFPWPDLRPEDDEPQVKEQRINEAMDTLFDKAEISKRGRVESLNKHARNLANKWFSERHPVVLRDSQLAKLEQIKKNVKDLPKVPELPESANKQNKKDHLEGYIDTVIKSENISPNRIDPNVREKFKSFIKPIVNDALDYYAKRKKLVIDLLASLPDDIDSVATPDDYTINTTKINELKDSYMPESLLGSIKNWWSGSIKFDDKKLPPGAAAGTEEKTIKYLTKTLKDIEVIQKVEREKQAAKKKVEDVASAFSLDAYKIKNVYELYFTNSKVMEKLKSLEGRMFSTRKEFQKKVASVLTIEEFAKYIYDIEKEAKIKVPDNIEGLTNRLLSMTPGIETITHDNKIYSAAVGRANQLARDLLDEKNKKLSKWKKQGRDLRRKLRENGNRKLEKELSGFISLKDPRAFNSSDFKIVARGLTYRMYPDKPPEVREEIEGEVEEIIKKKANDAKNKFIKIVEKDPVYWVPSVQWKEGPVRNEAIKEKFEFKRIDVIKDGVIRAIKFKNPKLAKIFDSNDGKKILEQFANNYAKEKLYEHIKNVETPEPVKKKKNEKKTVVEKPVVKNPNKEKTVEEKPVEEKPANNFKPKHFDCIVKVEANDNNSDVSITIESKKIRLIQSNTINRKNLKSTRKGVSTSMNNLVSKAPDIILNSFKETKGVVAKFNVAIQTRGRMLPIELPQMLAREMRIFFNNLHAGNSLIDPKFSTWIHDTAEGEPIMKDLKDMGIKKG